MRSTSTLPVLFTLSVLACGTGSGSKESGQPGPEEEDAETDADADADADSDADADVDADADSDADADADADADDTGEASDPLSACRDDLVPALEWWEHPSEYTLAGDVSFAQTHVIREGETRWAPDLIAERATMLLFEPDLDLAPETDVRVAAWRDGERVGVLPMADPAALPAALEQDLTDTTLDPWSSDAWSVMLPFGWITEGVTLTIGVDLEDALWVREVDLVGLAPPNAFTLSRSKMVLFGEEDKDTFTMPREQVGRDFFGAFPSSSMRVVDSAPWRVDEIVVRTESGPMAVTSEGERLDVTSDGDRWHIVKHQFAIAMSLANTGRGLARTSGGDSSPYSFGTSIGSGWVMNDDGTYVDLNNAPWAAGWTGWTGIWLGECGNAFIHEVGHSGTLLHFVDGTATIWGIADEYPIDGINLPSHPWGFDTIRGQFRTWYRVNAAGPATDDIGELIGKRDPMNGGESGNAVSCYPQYTAYHAWQINNWINTSPTIRTVDDEPGIYAWNPETSTYEPSAPLGSGSMDIASVDGPVATVIGAFGHDPAEARIYPPIHFASGNVFDYPDAISDTVDEHYIGAQYFLKVRYADGTTEHMLIAQAAVEPSDMAFFQFSVNIDMDREPVDVGLYAADSAYPDLAVDDATLIASRAIVAPTESPPEPVRMGRGHMANGAVYLTDLCEPGVNCDERREQTSWRRADVPIHFRGPDDAAETTLCGEANQHSVLEVPVSNLEGEVDTLIVHAQRVVEGPGGTWAGPINDVTPWLERPNLEQRLRLWAPYEENTHLGEGTWTHAGDYRISALEAEVLLAEVPVKIDIRVYEPEVLNLADAPYEGPSALAETASSTYFVLTDAFIGPTAGVWWGTSDATPLRIPVISDETGEEQTLNVNAWKRSCWLGWDTWWNLNSGQVADATCAQWTYMELGENDHLESGHTYRSPASEPVIIRAMAWHLGTEIRRDAFTFEHIAP